MKLSSNDAMAAMLSHHEALSEGVATRTRALQEAVSAGRDTARATADLLSYFASEVLPHAAAEEATIYAAGAATPGLSDVVADMTQEHRELGQLVAKLGTAGPADARHYSEQMMTLFVSHVAKENELILPVLAEGGDTDLGELLSQMQQFLREASESAKAGSGGGGAEGELLSLLLKGATELAEAGRGDSACRLAASAWSALAPSRPDLAERVGRALHKLVRSLPDEASGALAEPSSDEEVLDVRELPPAKRHSLIFSTFGQLAPGVAFVLVNDHDPKPLRYQFDAEMPGQVGWDYIEAGPKVWRVRISKRIPQPPVEVPLRRQG